MPLVTGRHRDLLQLGPQLPIAIAASARYLESLNIAPEEAPKPVRGMALIDTGASRTVIQSGTGKELGLNPVGRQNISTASTDAVPCDQYDVNLLFVAQNVHFANLVVIEAPIRLQPVICLIGRDVLSQAVFVYIGYDNSFTLAF